MISLGATTDFALHDAAPPVGSLEVITCPAWFPAAQNEVVGHVMASMTAPGVTLSLDQASTPPVGSDETTRLPSPSPATHRVTDGHEIEANQVPGSTSRALPGRRAHRLDWSTSRRCHWRRPPHKERRTGMPPTENGCRPPKGECCRWGPCWTTTTPAMASPRRDQEPPTFPHTEEGREQQSPLVTKHDPGAPHMTAPDRTAEIMSDPEIRSLRQGRQ